jgi:hypothetical protein
MRQITHAEYEKDYRKGYEDKQKEILADGFETARRKFNEDFPVGVKPKSLQDYYIAVGQIEALIKHNIS